MNQAAWLPLLGLTLAGAATAFQAPINARLASGVGSPINAAFISFAVGTVALGVAAALLNSRPDMGLVRGLPAWAWIGGLCGCIFVASAAWGVPRYGAALVITLMVAGQLLAGLALDHFGAFGIPRHPMSLGRIGGVVLVLLGVLMVRRF